MSRHEGDQRIDVSSEALNMTPETQEVFRDALGITDRYEPDAQEAAQDFFGAGTTDTLQPGSPNEDSVQLDRGPDEPESTPVKKTWGDESQGEKTFETEVDYLNWKKGHDGMKWGQEKAELNSKIAALEARLEERDKFQQVQQQQQPETPALSQVMNQLFTEERLESDDWKPLLKEVGQAIMKYDQLVAGQLQRQQALFEEKLGELKGSMTEVSARSKYGIDAAEEQKILEQKSPQQREILKRMPLEDRLAMISGPQESQPPSHAEVSPEPQRAIPRLQESDYVEGSAPRLPDRSTQEMTADFDSKTFDEQLKIIGGQTKLDPEFASNFKVD